MTPNIDKKGLFFKFIRETQIGLIEKNSRQGEWREGSKLERRNVRKGEGEFQFAILPQRRTISYLPSRTAIGLDAALSTLNGDLQDLFRIFHLPFQ